MDTHNIQETTIQVPSVNTKTLTIDLWKALGILGGAVLVAVVTTAFAAGRTINSDHFATLATAADVAEIKTSYVRSDVYTANQAAITSSLRDIKDQLTALNQARVMSVAPVK